MNSLIIQRMAHKMIRYHSLSPAQFFNMVGVKKDSEDIEKIIKEKNLLLMDNERQRINEYAHDLIESSSVMWPSDHIGFILNAYLWRSNWSVEDINKVNKEAISILLKYAAEIPSGLYVYRMMNEAAVLETILTITMADAEEIALKLNMTQDEDGEPYHVELHGEYSEDDFPPSS